MKHFAFAALCALPFAVHAQSSVTLSGTVDGGLTFISNAAGHHQYLFGSGTESPNRLTFSGVEDLGGGLSTIFNLENSFSIGNGTIAQAGTFFGHQAYVGLSNHTGTVTLGRQISDTFTSVGTMEAGGNWAAAGAGYGNHFGDIDDMDTLNRINNAIKFQSKPFGGFNINGVYSPGGKAGSFSTNQIWDASATYTNGQLRAGVGYLHINSPNFSFWGNNANSSTTGNNILNPVFNGYASARTQQVISAGANYKIGPATVAAIYSNVQFQDLGSVGVAGLNPVERSYTGNVALNIGELNLKYQVSPFLMLGAAYIYLRNGGADNAGTARYQQVDLGAVYSLSVRTSFYAVGVFQTASGTDSTGGPAVAAISATTPSSTNHQVVFTVGMSQKF